MSLYQYIHPIDQPSGVFRLIDWMEANSLSTDYDTVNTDGSYSYTDKIASNPKGFSAAMGDYSIIWGNGNEPGCFTEKQLRPGLSLSTVIDNTEKVQPFLQDVTSAVLPILDSDTQSQLNYLVSECKNYAQESWAKLVTGELSFDKWDAYCKQLESMGYRDLEKMLKEMLEL